MKRINVIGTSGSGKSTFSKQLASKLQSEHIEMDALFWGKDWYWPSDEEFFSKLKSAITPESWVLDGNYTRTIPTKWETVDTVVWVDYSFTRTFFQALNRAITRIVTKKELWPDTGNRESFKKTFLSKDSIMLWTLQNYSKNKQKYEAMMQDPKYTHINFVRLKSPKDSAKFLDQLA